MGIEPKKICRIIRPRGDNIDILTTVPEKELIAELEFRGETDDRNRTWARFEGINSIDERVPVAVIRDDIRGYLILPFHPSQAGPQPQAPRLIQ